MSYLNMLFQLQRCTVLPLPITCYCVQARVCVREDHCDILLLQTSADATSNYLLLSLLRSSVSTAVHRTKGPLSLPSILTRASNYIIVLRRHSQTLVPPRVGYML